MQSTIPSSSLIILTYQAEKDIPHLMPAIMAQTLQPKEILVIDSSSTDRTTSLLSSYPVRIHRIPQSEFDHGGTRKLATQLTDADIFLFLTQDAYPANPHAFAELIRFLSTHQQLACVYGRQLPKQEATPISAHARLFNYSTENYIRNRNDIAQYGIKTCFNSDSFSAYKKQPLHAIGNFPTHLITGEDAYVAAKLILKGYSVGYAANACVFHSHNLTLQEEFHRYFSIGVFHGRENWILKNFNSATNEGIRFVKSELNYLINQRQFKYIPHAILSTFIKFFAYHLGKRDRFIPRFLKMKMGINKSFWKKSVVKI